MAPRDFHLHDGKKGAALALRVTPRASKNEIVEVLSDGTVKSTPDRTSGGRQGQRSPA